MVIPDSPSCRGEIHNENLPQPVPERRAETPKSESPEADNIIRSIPPSDPSTAHPPMVQQTEQPQNSFLKPLLPPSRTKTIIPQTPNRHRGANEMVTAHHTTPEGQVESPKSDGKLRRPTSTGKNSSLGVGSWSGSFASRKVPQSNIWDDDIEETLHGHSAPLSAKRPKQHHALPSALPLSEPRRDSTYSREPSVAYSTFSNANKFLKPLTPGDVCEGGPKPRIAQRPEKQTQSSPETPLTERQFQDSTQSEAFRRTPIIDEQAKATDDDYAMDMEIDAGAPSAKPDDGSPTGERSMTRSIASGERGGSSRGRSLGSIKSTEIVPEGEMLISLHREEPNVHEQTVEYQTKGAGSWATEAKDEEEDDDGDEVSERESESEAFGSKLSAPAKKPLAKQLSGQSHAEQSSTKTIKQIVPQRKQIDNGPSEPEKLQVNVHKDAAPPDTEIPQFKTPSAKRLKAATSSIAKLSSTSLYPATKSALKLAVNRSGSASSRGTPPRVSFERSQSQSNAARSSPSLARRPGSHAVPEEKISKAPTAAIEKSKTPEARPTPAAMRRQLAADKRLEDQRRREEIKNLSRLRKSPMIHTEPQPVRGKGKEIVRDPPAQQVAPPPPTTTIFGTDTRKLECKPLQSGNEPAPSRRCGDRQAETVETTATLESKSRDVLDARGGRNETPKVDSTVQVQKEPTAHVATGNGKSPSRSPARVVASSISSSSASETESETESESESETVEEKVDETGRPPSSTSQEAASGTSKDIGRSASPSASSSSESESDDGDLPPLKRTPPQGTDKSRSASVGDEAERQLQREARESLEPSRSSQVKSAAKTPLASKPLAIVNEGRSTNARNREAPPATTRFPSLTSLRARSSGLPPSSTQRLSNYKTLLKGPSGPNSLGTQVNRSTKITEVSSDEDSSTSEDEGDEDDDLGTGAKSAGTGGAQGSVGKGVAALTKRKFRLAIVPHYSLYAVARELKSKR